MIEVVFFFENMFRLVSESSLTVGAGGFERHMAEMCLCLRHFECVVFSVQSEIFGFV